jgi:hypothetical protein
MRLDYFCQLTVTDSKGVPLTFKALKRLDGFVDKTEAADFTIHMDEDMAEQLIGEPIRFVLREETLFARVSLHEKTPLPDDAIKEITEYVLGQFLDGYGEDRIDIRKLRKTYYVDFADSVEGPIKVAAKRPKKKPKRKSPTKLFAISIMPLWKAI